MLALLPSACEPLVDGNHLGDPIFAVEGIVSGRVAEGTPHVALFWAMPNEAGAWRAIGQDVLGVTQTLLRYRLELFLPPTRGYMQTLADGETITGSSPRIGLALVQAYLDLDGDELWTPQTEVRSGASPEYVVAYLPEFTTAPLLGDEPVTAGLHRMRVESPLVACDLWGEMRLVPDDWDDLDHRLTQRSFPQVLPLDFSCTDITKRFDSCVSFGRVRDVCELRATPPEAYCVECEAMLSPESGLANRDRCDEWLLGCLPWVRARECQWEWSACLGDDPRADEYGACGDDLACICKEQAARCDMEDRRGCDQRQRRCDAIETPAR